jgi:ubiquinone/menaquinone biosynthesis C-methylase UbiE
LHRNPEVEKRHGIKEYSPKEYWNVVAKKFGSSDGSGFAPVLHPDAPVWFNELIDDLQFRAMRRALAVAEPALGSRFLDVGCGTGRWIRRYQELGLRATGVDATPGMLRTARERGTTAPLIAGDACRLPVADACFDAVSDVTVVQHIPLAQQAQALGEMLRVLKPGGRLILIELIRGQGTHIFPRSPADWIQQVNSRGGKLLSWFGQEFLLLDRIFTNFVQSISSHMRERDPNGTPTNTERRTSQIGRVYWEVRHATTALAAWTEPATERIFPGRLATHGVFVFKK